MTGRKKQGMLLAALVPVWMGLAWMQIAGQPEPQRLPLTYKTGQQRTTPGAAMPTLPVSAGTVTGAGHVTPVKNIFAPLPSARTPALPSAGTAASAKKQQSKYAKHPAAPATGAPPSEDPVASAEDRAIDQARRRLAKYRFLGYLQRGGRRQAFLSDGSETHVLQVGERVGDRILVTALDAAAVTLMETATRVVTSIPLTPQPAPAGSPPPSGQAPAPAEEPAPAEPIPAAPPTQAPAS